MTSSPFTLNPASLILPQTPIPAVIFTTRPGSPSSPAPLHSRPPFLSQSHPPTFLPWNLHPPIPLSSPPPLRRSDGVSSLCSSASCRCPYSCAETWTSSTTGSPGTARPRPPPSPTPVNICLIPSSPQPLSPETPHPPARDPGVCLPHCCPQSRGTWGFLPPASCHQRYLTSLTHLSAYHFPQDYFHPNLK